MWTRLVSGLIAICRAGTLISFLVLVGSVTLQVIGRLPGIPAPPWTEEIARFSVLYLVAFSCGLAQLRGELVAVDLFVNMLPPRGTRVASVLSVLVVIAFAAVIVKPAFFYVGTSFGEIARSISLPMPWIYSIAIIIPISLIVFSVARLFATHSTPHSDGNQD
ncbi:TRAP transporter small permease [Shumkonia mesophila]|uniref:TRAP transporter small permease n=1 Tax=Shumkonia mesophila TaxID=2838854 RepID=UPI0029349C33|nr:TRAP transporter small permease [Shumkonia mesophila]